MGIKAIIQKTVVISALILSVGPTFALDVNGQGDRSGVQALYLFNEGSGNVVVDEIATGGQLNLTVVNPTNVTRTATSIELRGGAGIRSTGPANKIINACRASNEITIEAWIESRLENDIDLAAYGPARILSLSRGVHELGGFFVGQGYDAGHFYNLGINTRTTINNNELALAGDLTSTDPAQGARVVNHSRNGSRLQHLVVSKNRDGLIRIFVSDASGVPILQASRTTTVNFSGWRNDFVLTLGNDALFDQDIANGFPILTIPNYGNRSIQDKDWQGAYHMLAIYCEALSDERILADRAPTDWLVADANFTIDPNREITPARQLAQVIYRRVVGYNIPIDHPVLDGMELALLPDMNSVTNRLAAARIASDRPGFYNRTVKDFAKRMSNRDHAVNVPLNDFVASIIGVTRDNVDARELLRGDFYYRARLDRTAAPSDLVADLLTSNRHFEALETLNYDLSSVLERVNGQQYYDGVSRTVAAANYDAAGILTSRAFLSAHAVAGTNRRLVEFSFSEFLCAPITQWGSNTAPDEFVGRDVDRFPTGEHQKYQVTCRGCHAQMDGLRGAFARITFETNFVKHAWVMTPDASTNPNQANNNENMGTMVQVPRGISGKMNQNGDVFNAGIPEGQFLVRDSSWENFATRGVNHAYFGWRVPGGPNNTTVPAPEGESIRGSGISQFGSMLAESRAFSDCLTKRVFRSVCKRDPSSAEQDLINRVSTSFRAEDGYSLRRLFERVSVQRECLGQ